MKTGMTMIAALGLVAISGVTARAGLEGVLLGTEAPPKVLGGYRLSAFSVDPRPLLSLVDNAMVGPQGVIVSFEHSAQLRRLGAGWAMWGHGYAGSVYNSQGYTESSLTLPSGTRAFVFYVSSNTFGPISAEVSCTDGVRTAMLEDDGLLPELAHGYAFYATGNSELKTVDWEIYGAYGFGELLIASYGDCAADLDGDGQIDFADYLDFLNRFEAGDTFVDFNGDGLFDFSDYLEFLTLFDQGCDQ